MSKSEREENCTEGCDVVNVSITQSFTCINKCYNHCIFNFYEFHWFDSSVWLPKFVTQVYLIETVHRKISISRHVIIPCSLAECVQCCLDNLHKCTLQNLQLGWVRHLKPENQLVLYQSKLSDYKIITNTYLHTSQALTPCRGSTVDKISTNKSIEAMQVWTFDTFFTSCWEKCQARKHTRPLLVIKTTNGL